MKSYDWIRNHFRELVDTYPGKYIAVVEEEVVAVKDKPKAAEDEALKHYPESIPSVFLVPKKEDLACLL
ncbi:MAG: hypothetical protein KAU14_00975 [Thermoplasmata archaeon]|nr:hypothetical protein [Thermoplasmata archaeon]